LLTNTHILDTINGASQALPKSFLIYIDGFSTVEGFELAFCLLLVFFSALLSGAESSFFSLKSEDIQKISEKHKKTGTPVLYLYQRPKLLLATILISNTVCNILFAVLGATLLDKIHFAGDKTMELLINVVLLTFIIVLIGEVVPKVYAAHNNLSFASFMAYPLLVLSNVFYPFSVVLAKTTNLFERNMQKGHNVSINDIKNAIEMTSEVETSQEEKKILKGIISFGNTYAKQIMTSRVDVVAHDINTPFDQLTALINKNQYSRVPVYNGSFDRVEGILYIKDLLAHLNEPPGFDWKPLIREPYFVPEMKKIDLLLAEFKQKKMHMSIVVDEYGGTAGIVTMEDILEEIVGDINDEFDEDEVFYSKLDDNTYIFDGKTALTDVVRVMNIGDESFEKVRGEAESIGGLVVEHSGRIPRPKEKIEIGDFDFTVELSDRRRVRRVKVSRKMSEE